MRNLSKTASARKIILETAIQGDKVMQDFESGSFAMGVDHSQKVKATPIVNDYGSKDCVNLSPSIAVSRIIANTPRNEPNAETREALRESREKKLKSYKTLDEFWKAVGIERNASL